MATSSYPFEGQTTTETQYSRLFRELQDNGIMNAPDSTDLTVSVGSGMSVTVSPGRAYVRGFVFDSTSSVTLTINPAGSVTRTDQVVLRLDPATDSISLQVVAGDAATGAMSPLVQTDTGIWEHPIAQVIVPASAQSLAFGNVIDFRRYVGGRLGYWRTATRPSAPRMGQVGWNTNINGFERWSGTQWVSLTGDTGWLNLNVAAGHTGANAQVRQIGNLVEFQGTVTKNNGGLFTAVATTFASLPAGIGLSPVARRWMTAGFASASRPNSMLVLIGSQSTVLQAAGAAGNAGDINGIVYLDGVSYRVD